MKSPANSGLQADKHGSRLGSRSPFCKETGHASPAPANLQETNQPEACSRAQATTQHAAGQGKPASSWIMPSANKSLGQQGDLGHGMCLCEHDQPPGRAAQALRPQTSNQSSLQHLRYRLQAMVHRRWGTTSGRSSCTLTGMEPHGASSRRTSTAAAGCTAALARPRASRKS